ncbi:MAG: arylsulfatase, partial [Planctomycetaceae bacterium]
AAEGIQFRNMYAGCTVCAPSRSVLMTGRHMGHTHVRGNAGSDMSIQTLRPDDVTIAEVLQQAGYATGLFGKWGLGDEIDGGYEGVPNHQGFDEFFGYLSQLHAHNYYPEFLWRNRERVPLRNEVTPVGRSLGTVSGGYAARRVDYSHDLIMDEALKFIDRVHQGPFFLYLALTIPHANNEGTRATGNGQEVPDFGIYAGNDWSEQDQGQAAMITRMDAGIGTLLDRLAALGIDEQTLVIFTSDNGPHNEGGHNTERFVPAGPLRGRKRDLYEGGIRVPFIARWPGTAPAGEVSGHIGYFGDLMATAAELADVDPPNDIDSVSIVPILTGNTERQRQHEFLYWEFYERGGSQAVRQGRWKAVRMPMPAGRTELYNLDDDLGEARDVATEHPDIVKQLEMLMDAAHEDHPNWQPRGEPPSQLSPPGDGRPRF